MCYKMKIFSILFISTISSYAFNQCFTAGQVMQQGVFLKSSGVEEIDQLVYKEVGNLETFFGFDVHFLFQQEFSGVNARFYYQCEYGCTGTVALGINYLTSLFKRYNEKAFYLFQFALAHEFAHGAQKLGFWNEGYKRPELHADFLAGFYIGKNYNYSEELLNSFLAEARYLADNKIYSEEHHGLPVERECAFLEGYYFAKENNVNVQSAYVYGFEYVAANNPCAVRKYKAAVKQYENEVQRRKAKLDDDIAIGNVGHIHFKATDLKKYKIVTINGIGEQVVYPINQPYLGLNQNGQQAWYQPTNEVLITPLSANTNHPFQIYKFNWFFGDILVFQWTPTIVYNHTVEVEFGKKGYSVSQ